MNNSHSDKHLILLPMFQFLETHPPPQSVGLARETAEVKKNAGKRFPAHRQFIDHEVCRFQKDVCSGCESAW
jgi:hypothetical protein